MYFSTTIYESNVAGIRTLTKIGAVTLIDLYCNRVQDVIYSLAGRLLAIACPFSGPAPVRNSPAGKNL
jgi:hypothetical protein